MKVNLQWTEAMKLKGSTAGLDISMDAKPPIGHGTAPTPKELLGAGLGGCTAMDILALFKKHKQSIESFNVIVDLDSSSGSYPQVFTKAEISYLAQGPIDPHIFIEAVVLSQTKYCGVSAMLSKAFPIFYKIILNDEVIKEGQAHFES